MCRLLLSLCLFLGSVSLRADPIQLLVSSQPLALLLGEILPAAKPYELKLLIPPGASLHHPSLRPSQRAAIENSQLILWLGPRLEPGLAAYLGAVPAERVVALEQLVAFELIGLGSSGHIDGHIWLSPDNAAAIVAALADQLQQHNFSAAALDKNRRDFTAALEADMKFMKSRFASLNDRSFIAVHDAFAYLGDYFKLNQLGALIDANDQPAGARTLWDIERRIAPGSDICLLGDTRYPPDQGKELGQMTAFHRVSIDLTGGSYQPSKGAYLRYFNGVLDSIYSCLLSNTGGL